MKSRNRQVNIFNMSVLDLLTGALGAFCFLTLALFPSYFKNRAFNAATKKTEAKSRSDSAKKEVHSETQKNASKQVPPFALASLHSYLNILNVPYYESECAVLDIQTVQAPPGPPGLGFRALQSAAGGHTRYDFFAFRPGQYHLVVDVRRALPACFLTLAVQSPLVQRVTHKVTGPGPLQFNFQITQADLRTNVFH